MKQLLTLLCLMSSVAFALPQAISDKEKKDFVTYYRSWRKLLEEFPDKPQVNFLFTDINSDGVLEAIATSHGECYEDGYSWTIFQRSGLSWAPVKLKMKDATTVDQSSSLLARSDEFYLLTGSGGKHDLAVLHKHYDTQIEGGMSPSQNSKVTISKESLMISEKLPSLDQIVAYSPGFLKLERLKVESFKD